MGDVFRKEIKYIISIHDYYKLKSKIEHYLKMDKNSKDHMGYRVRTLYFDSYYDRDLVDVVDGIMEKRKIRLRYYNADDNEIRLEYKCKCGNDLKKFVRFISRDEAKDLIDRKYDILLNKKDPLFKEIFTRLKLGAYRPKIIVEYNRLAYICEQNDIRITFDKNIKASQITTAFFDTYIAGIPILSSDFVVLEVKYNGFLLNYLKETLESIDNTPIAYSKYASSRLLNIF